MVLEIIYGRINPRTTENLKNPFSPYTQIHNSITGWSIQLIEEDVKKYVVTRKWGQGRISYHCQLYNGEHLFPKSDLCARAITAGLNSPFIYTEWEAMALMEKNENRKQKQ